MRMSLLFSCAIVSALAAGALAQGTTAQPPQGTTQPKPAPPATAKPAPPATAKPADPATQKPAAAPPRRAPAANRAGMAITVTNQTGATLPSIKVTASGPTMRDGETDASGHLDFTTMQAGTYRLRFDGEDWISFEREVTLRAGQVADVDVALNPAPEPPPPPEPLPAPPDPEPLVGPVGQPQTIAIPDWLEREFVGRDPRRETLLACSGNERTTIVQLNEPMPQRLYDNADVVYYVLGGEGTVTLDGRSSRVPLNSFISVPRGTAHSFERRGNRPLMLLSVLGGAPCEEAK